jgi:hypothetical protein
MSQDVDLVNLRLEPSKSEKFAIVEGLSGVKGRIARTWNHMGGLISACSNIMKVNPAVLTSIFFVEGGGEGFAPDGRLIIRFEPRIFHRIIGQASDWKLGGQKEQWENFERACRIDREAAMKSTSYGSSQIMGFNYRLLGYKSPEEMFETFKSDIRYHLLGFFDLLMHSGRMIQAIWDDDFGSFSKWYNGPSAAETYAKRIEEAIRVYNELRSSS